jgi:hypothetical protein
MIILSQDEEKIVNFDNVTSIGMIEFTNYISIKAKFQDMYIELGIYKNEARAKEVLKEILDWVADTDGEDCKIFYMPKE